MVSKPKDSVKSIVKGRLASDESTRAPSSSDEVDEAMKAVEWADGQPIEIDEQTNKRLLRKIDWHLMPLICVINAMAMLDSMSPSHISNAWACADGIC